MFGVELLMVETANKFLNGASTKFFSHFVICKSCCAKRSLRPCEGSNRVFRVSVRSSVRPFGVRKIITFCEAYMRGSQVPENSGVLKTRF